MAHPYSSHREDKAGKDRAKHILKGHKRGGMAKHSDEPEDKALFNKMFKEKMEHKVPEKASGGRLDKYARGGKAKNAKTTININISPKNKDEEASPDGMLPPPPAPPLPPPMPPKMPPPGMMPPGAGGPPPGLGLMKRGGTVKMKGGAETGEGRLDKIKAYGKNAKK